MESEALRNIRTMRQVTTSLDIAKRRRPAAANSLSVKKGDTVAPPDARLSILLARESRRMRNYEASIMKSRGRLLKMRAKLAAIIDRNRSLGALRQQIQASYWTPAGKPAPQPECLDRLGATELRY
ncbi:MAG: hypothetical protein HYX96_07480 [Chloroflexi bacterium]|nr:hypothetical protein [Chloroflexota bacterium]